MQHLNDEELVAHHYGDADAAEHLHACAECAARLTTLRQVLALVDAAEVPVRGAEYPEQMWNRLRWRLERRERKTRRWLLAIAAALAMVLAGGELLRNRRAPAGTRQPLAAATATAPDQGSNVLANAVGDHLDDAERVLTEIANADPARDLDVSSEQSRAEDLVTSNRIYRQTAMRRGDARIASVLSDIEPVLIELSHAGKLSSGELAELQKRIESRNLLFKLRVLNSRTERPNHNLLAANRMHSL